MKLEELKAKIRLEILETQVFVLGECDSSIRKLEMCKDDLMKAIDGESQKTSRIIADGPMRYNGPAIDSMSYRLRELSDIYAELEKLELTDEEEEK